MFVLQWFPAVPPGSAAFPNVSDHGLLVHRILGGGTASVNTKVADEACTSHQEMRRLECDVERRNVIHGAGKGEKGAR